MKNLWQILGGIMIALASIGLILGGISLSLAEGNLTTKLAPTLTLPPTSSPAWQPCILPTDSPTPPPFTWTPSLPPSPTSCPSPPGWLPYVVQPDDTLDALSAYYQISSAELGQANCLPTKELLLGAIVYVPPMPTQTPVPCGPPRTWVAYTIQAGDTLYHLSWVYGITVVELQRANCLGHSTLIRTGRRLYVPPWATRTPSPTASSTVAATDTPTDTPTILPSDTPTATFTSSPSDMPTEIPTDTQTPSPTLTNTP
jgi:LysM repeat protein